MVFECDETKRRECIAKHRVDLAYVAQIFLGQTLTEIDSRFDYGETRSLTIGRVDGEYFVVVHTKRGEVTRLISAWKGGRDDQRRYQESLAGGSDRDEGEG